MADGPAASWTGIPVFGTYLNFDGTPKQGKIVFTIATRIVDNTDDIIFPGGGAVQVTLGAETGTASVNVPAVDDPDISPNDWQVRVDEKLTDGSGKSYYIQPLLADLNNTPPGINLRQVVVPPDAPNAAPPTYMRGVAGGVAALDSAGNVLDADGNTIGGGSGSVTVTDNGDGTCTIS